MKANSVKVISSLEADPSPGKDNHLQQVVPDRQPATLRNKECNKIGTWNVRTLYQAGMLENEKQEIEQLEITSLGLTQIKSMCCLGKNEKKTRLPDQMRLSPRC